MKRAAFIACIAAGACRVFSDDLYTCIASGRCEGPDGGIVGDAGCVPDGAGLCIESKFEAPYGAFSSVNAIARDEVWVGSIAVAGGVPNLFRCDSRGPLASSGCRVFDIRTNEQLNQIRNDGQRLLIAGHEGRVITVDRADAGTLQLSVPGTRAMLAVAPGAAGAIWASGSSGGIFKISLPSGVVSPEQVETDGGDEKVFDLWSDGTRATLAIGIQADRAGVFWAWDGIAWRRHSEGGLDALRSISGTGANVYAVAARDTGAQPLTSIYRVDLGASPPRFDAVFDGGVDLFDVWVSGNGAHVYAVGPSGIFARVRDGGFERLSTPWLAGYDLWSVDGLESGELYVAAGKPAVAAGDLFHMRFVP